MGFELVKAQAAPTDAPGGWAKHVFYATGDVVEGESPELIAFWELHDDRWRRSTRPSPWASASSRG